MNATLWAPLISGFAGVAGALGGTWLTQNATRRREEANYQRVLRDRRDERQEALYLDLFQHLEATTEWVDRLTGETSGVDLTLNHPIPTTMLTARVDFHGGADLFNAWMEYVVQINVFLGAIRDAEDRPYHEWVGDERVIVELRRLIEEVRGELRAGSPGAY